MIVTWYLISNGLHSQKNNVLISNRKFNLHKELVGGGCMMNKKQPINPPAG